MKKSVSSAAEKSNTQQNSHSPLVENMLNNIKFDPEKVRKSLVYLELILRNAYLCPRFQMKGIDYQNLFR